MQRTWVGSQDRRGNSHSQRIQHPLSDLHWPLLCNVHTLINTINKKIKKKPLKKKPKLKLFNSLIHSNTRAYLLKTWMHVLLTWAQQYQKTYETIFPCKIIYFHIYLFWEKGKHEYAMNQTSTKSENNFWEMVDSLLPPVDGVLGQNLIWKLDSYQLTCLVTSPTPEIISLLTLNS